MGALTGIVAQWIFRRILELGGLLAAGLTAWNGLPPEVQGAIIGLLGTKWEQISLGTAVGIGVALWGYAWSFISTVKPHVTVDGRQTPISSLPNNTAVLVEETARTVQQKRQTLFDIIGGLFKR
ncbi:hypothetical protein [Devosia sp. MC1541]|uniref:hypothetical protein n=1 Tax=Devosia sp. MC1541 TaxID=2725264 RepID=UPI00145FBCAD|nr:hypothetical protein [Devosia sp. MC1541]